MLEVYGQGVKVNVFQVPLADSTIVFGVNKTGVAAPFRWRCGQTHPDHKQECCK